MAKVEKHCLQCGKPFEVFSSEIKKGGGKFCSRSCATTFRNIHNNPTEYEEVRRKISLHHADVSGENNPMYGIRGENAPSYIDGRSFFTGETYRKKLLASGREMVCEICGTSEDLCVHHKDKNHGNNELENLAWLCMRCHNNIVHRRSRDKNGRFLKEERK